MSAPATFQCANCRQVINVGATTCPFCRHNPFYAATQDTGTRADRVAPPSNFGGMVAILCISVGIMTTHTWAGPGALWLGWGIIAFVVLMVYKVNGFLPGTLLAGFIYMVYRMLS